jgi:hypothetical protein
MYTPNATKGAVIKTDFSGGDLLTSVKWMGDGWHIVLFAKNRGFETEKESQQVTVSCNGEPFGDPPRQVKSDVNTDQIELDIDTKIKNEKVKSFPEGRSFRLAGKSIMSAGI